MSAIYRFNWSNNYCHSKGSEINKKLETFDSSIDISIEGTVTSPEMDDISIIRNSFNPNYKPPKESHKELIVSIDRSKVCPIAHLTPYLPQFVIRGRITSKTVVKNYKHKNGSDGKLFSFDVTDDSSEIRITGFNNECDKYWDLIQKDLVYYISKGSIKYANKQYSKCKSDYEILLTSDSTIELCDEEMVPLPSIQYNFVGIQSLVTQKAGSSVDVIGVITAVEELQEVISKKNQKLLNKRDVHLLDKTLHEIKVTLWGEDAINFVGTPGQVLAVKNIIVGDFKGKTLSCAQNSVLELNPDLKEAYLLKGWYDTRADQMTNVVHLSRGKDENPLYVYLCHINQQSIPEGTTVYFNFKATILGTNRTDKHLYKSCATDKCLKKVKEENNFYYCEKCKTNSNQFKWRLMLTINCSDCTSDIWMTAFQEVSEKIIGKSVDELSQIFEKDPKDYQSLISHIYFKSFIFRIGSKVEEYNNEKRVKSTCVSVTSIQPIERSKKLIHSLKSWI